ncbi:transcriptional regulator GcvA [Pusillimonas caeni]|uniref:transcriptional regulator GcvA n=1 Tax=Pusillimonas caeni TaxID=1348472 RepID=UPI000E59C7B9|nr:transcriptional regulator GcvA [Pusillimonas caeni]TFL10216.1 transcriptional regulator GcvA [Pusillimonas caeni]
MTRRLAPLNAMRAFESAGRHLSFSRAADELHVTQSAISRQVRLLEDQLGVSLFERKPRSISLTPKGKQYLDDITDAFALLEDATNRVRERQNADILKLQVFSTFALRWLIPRLGNFAEEHPEIEVQLMTLSPSKPVNFEHEFTDACIRTGFGDWPGMRSDRLISNKLIAVCSKDVAKTLSSPDDLAKVTLLHSYARPDDWRKWLSPLGASSVDPSRGLKFENSSLAYQAAIEGIGVAIAQAGLVQKELQNGDLVIPFPYVMPAEKTYFLISPNRQEPQRIAVFREWILRKCREEDDSLAELDLIPLGP